MADPSAQLVERPAACPQSLASGLALSCLLPMLRLALKPTVYGSFLLALGENSLWASQRIVTCLYVCLNEVRPGLASGRGRGYFIKLRRPHSTQSVLHSPILCSGVLLCQEFGKKKKRVWEGLSVLSQAGLFFNCVHQCL